MSSNVDIKAILDMVWLLPLLSIYLWWFVLEGPVKELCISCNGISIKIENSRVSKYSKIIKCRLLPSLQTLSGIT